MIAMQRLAPSVWRWRLCSSGAVTKHVRGFYYGPLEKYVTRWAAQLPSQPGVSEGTHLRIVAMLREGMGREGTVVPKETRHMRNEAAWITAQIQGGGPNTNTFCQVLRKELTRHYKDGRYILASAGSPFFTGPLYDLIVVSYNSNLRHQETFRSPTTPERQPRIVERVRAHAHCLQIHPLRDFPNNVRFARIPPIDPRPPTKAQLEPDEQGFDHIGKKRDKVELESKYLVTKRRIRYRVPIVQINRDKCDALRMAETFYLAHGIDVVVPMDMANPPQVAMLDMSKVVLNTAVFPRSVILPEGVTLSKRVSTNHPILVVK